MQRENLNKLQTAIVRKTIDAVKIHGGHGMVLTITFTDGTTLDICTYDDGKDHETDQFYVALNDKEL